MAAQLPRTYQPGHPIYYEGTPALAVFCIHEGEVRLWRIGSAGDLTVIATRGRGALLGYRAVLSGNPYAVTAEPVVQSSVCTISRETFVSLVRENPQLAFRLLQLMANQTLETEDLLVARVLDRVKKRSARLLLHLVPDTGAAPRQPPVLLPRIGRRDLAHLIGTTPETLSRTLHALASRGVLDLPGHDIIVLDMDTLRRLAE